MDWIIWLVIALYFVSAGLDMARSQGWNTPRPSNGALILSVFINVAIAIGLIIYMTGGK